MADTTSLRASVVVMTFNRPDGLRRCLASLAAQSLDRADFDVVVVDVSTPPVSAVIADFREQLVLVHHPAANLGVARNRNVGARLARGATLAFLDDDCVASPEWLRMLVEAVERDPAVLAGAPTVHPSPTSASAAAGQVITEAVDAFFNAPGQSARFLPGLNFALNRERFLSIGGCDPDFQSLAAEDRDLVDRWLRAGGRLAVCRGADVRHEHRSSLRGFIRQYFNYGRGAWRYHRLRRQRRHGRMMEDARLHLRLPSYLRTPIASVPRRFVVQVVCLIVVWQCANLAGFLWQAGLETAAPNRGTPRG